MDALTLMKALSVALVAGSASLLIYEWRFYKRSFLRQGSGIPGSPDTGRLVRRTVGSALLLTLAVLIFFGRLPESGSATPEQVMSLFYYWTSVLAIALLLGGLALYDALAGMRRLGGYMALVEGQEMTALAQQLREAQAKQSRKETGSSPFEPKEG